MIEVAYGCSKLIRILKNDPRVRDYQDLEDVPKHYLDEISEFFKTYKTLEEGKHTVVEGWVGREEALAAISYGLSWFREKFAYV